MAKGTETTEDKVQELQRKLYLKAKSEPNFRFYALYDRIYRLDVLTRAYERVKQNHGSPGIDGQTIKDIEYQGVETFIKGIQDELRTKRYRPTPVRRVNIPKPDGKKRPLGIPTIKDRVVQMALKIVIEPIFEADFEDNSYGYRPRRSAQQALQEIRKYLNYGYNRVIEGDIRDCFGTIPHRELIDMIRTRIVDGSVLRLIKMFLTAGVMVDGEIKVDDKGTPQGGVISPLLANIYLDKLDKGWKSYNRIARLIRYADDFVILTRYKAEDLLMKLRWLISGLGLDLNLEKTKIVETERETFDFLGFTFKRARSRKGKVVAYYWPSHKAEIGIKARVREITDIRRAVKIVEIIPELNRTIRGWVNYFKMGNSSKKFGKIKWYVENRVRKFMRRHGKRYGYGYKQYPSSYLYGELGLYSDYRVSWMKAVR